MYPERLIEEFGAVAQAPGGVERLRGLVLDLAVRGRLVEQDPADEPAIDLLLEISAERAERTGRPKEKPQILLKGPHEIPSAWEWVSFGSTHINRDSERVPLSRAVRADRQGPYAYYGASGVIDAIDDFLFDGPLLLIGEDGANLVLRSTPIAFLADGKYWVNNHAHVLDSTEVDSLRYLSIFVNATDLRPFLTGTAQPKLNQRRMNGIPCAFPPLAEQRRIVARVDELMALCDKLEEKQARCRQVSLDLPASLYQPVTEASSDSERRSAWVRVRKHFDDLTDSPDQIPALRQAILELAVRGRLVEQDPEDESASVWLEEVRRVREALVRRKEVRRRRLAPINTKAMHELPKKWAWARLGDMTRDWGQKRPPSDFTYIDVSSIDNRMGRIRDPEALTAREAPSRARKKVRVGSVLYSTVRPYLLNIAIVEEDLDPTPIASTAFAVLHPLCGFSSRYLYLYLRSPVFTAFVEREMTGVAYPAISDKKLYRAPIAVPPLAEQRRIVARVDELMALCDELEGRLARRERVQGRFAEALTAVG